MDPRIGEGVISITATIAPLPIIVIENENKKESNNVDAHVQGDEGRLLFPGNRWQQPQDRGRRKKEGPLGQKNEITH